MRIAEVCREAWRDVASGASWAGTWAMVFGVLLTGIVGIRTADLAGDVRSAAAYVASGAATTVQRAEGRIDGRACDALASSEGVVASGALRRVEHGAVAASLPGSAVPTYEVTPGMLRVLGAGASAERPGVVLSPSVRESLGTRPGRNSSWSMARPRPWRGRSPTRTTDETQTSNMRSWRRRWTTGARTTRAG